MTTTPIVPARQEVITQMVELFAKIPAHARARFARGELIARFSELVQTYEAIPLHRRARSILFYAPTPHSRETRIAQTARLAGWDTYLLTAETPKYDVRTNFAHAVQVDDVFLQILVVWLFPGVLVHAFALQGGILNLVSFFKPKRLIVDLYDTAEGMFAEGTEAVKVEQRVLAEADAVTHRDLRIKRLQRRRGYTLPRNNLFLHDPLPREPAPLRALGADEPIHVVSVGWIGSGANSILRVARSLCEGGVHLHVYFNPFQQGAHPDTLPYLQLQAECPRFHIHPQVYGEAYWSELSRYHFGLCLIEPPIFGEPTVGYTEDAISACGSSRLSDYISAGLGVINVPALKFQNFWARRYATVTVEATRALLADPEPRLREAFGKRRWRNLKPITDVGAAGRLGNFYHRVALAKPLPTKFAISPNSAPSNITSKIETNMPSSIQDLMSQYESSVFSGDLETACRHLQQVIRMAGDQPDLLSALGTLLLLMGRPAEAEAAAWRSIAIDCNHEDTLKLLGRLRVKAGRPQPQNNLPE